MSRLFQDKTAIEMGHGCEGGRRMAEQKLMVERRCLPSIATGGTVTSGIPEAQLLSIQTFLIQRMRSRHFVVWSWRQEPARLIELNERRGRALQFVPDKAGSVLGQFLRAHFRFAPRQTLFLPEPPGAQSRQNQDGRKDKHALPEETRLALDSIIRRFAHLAKKLLLGSRPRCHDFVKHTASGPVGVISATSCRGGPRRSRRC